MPDKLEVGIVGAGQVSQRAHAPVVSKLRSAGIKYIADINESCKRLADSYDTESVVIDSPSDLPRADCVVLAIPLGARKPYFEELQYRNTPIFAEKPFAPNIDVHQEFDDGNSFCDYMRLCFSNTIQLKTIVESEIFGSVNQVTVREEGKVGATGLAKGSYKIDPDMSGGGILFERGTHTLSQLEYIFDSWDFEVVESEIYWMEELDEEVKSKMKISNSNQESADVEYIHSRVSPVGNEFSIEFDNVVVSVNHTRPEDKIKVSDKKSRYNNDYALTHNKEWAHDINEAWFIRWSQFINKISGRSESPVAHSPTIETGEQVTKKIMELYNNEN